ncbi:MAG: 7-cyano-7-deazaguanine reductase [Desulfosporosinus sp. BRH_c37]|nr:MAG: 7-cyano-7-deazaguanine reductase [Desulfosporosinus sp. BRH_c37]
MIFKKLGTRVKQFLAKASRPFSGVKKKLFSMNRKQLLLIGLGGVLGIILLSGVALKVTSTPQFCSSCHEMTPEVATWQVSSHSKVSCVACHIEPGVQSLVKHKISSLTQLFEHITGTVPDPIVMPHPIKNESCIECHSMARKVTSSGDILIPHDKHLEQGIACVACHAGVAHGFVAERGLNGEKDFSTWTNEKAEKVMNFDETKLAMEVCMNCHEQVNDGKKPWLEHEGLGQSEKQRMEESQGHLQKQSEDATGKLSETAQTTTVATESGMHPPMNCSACHSASMTPDTHKNGSWKSTHGITATQDVLNCASCHSRQKERVLLTKDSDVKDYARSNTFCANCHAKRPAGHLENKQAWLPAHPIIVRNTGPANCLTCHDIEKPIIKAQSPLTQLPGQALPSPNAVYCNQCHWFKNNTVEFKTGK